MAKKKKVKQDMGGDTLPLIAMAPGDQATKLYANPNKDEDNA